MTTCVMGCTIAGRHLTMCDGKGDCRGCEPRQAAEGAYLCTWHVNRLTEAVAGFPDLHDWLLIVESDQASAAQLGEQRSSNDPGETVPIPASRLTADELWNELGTWARIVLEEHEPQLAGWEAINTTMPLWVLAWLPWMVQQPWIDEFAGQWLRDTQTARFRWPMLADVEPRRKVAVPCPRCQMRSLIYTPPTFFRQPFRVECTDPDCARTFSEDEWERFEMLALREAKV